MEYVIQSDLIIDFHEGWGFHRKDPESMGSGIYPGKTKFSIVLGNELLNHVMDIIENLVQTIILNRTIDKLKSSIPQRTKN
jgi:hypothetical protein